MSRDIIIVGGGGHARVLADALLGQGLPVLGYTDPVASGDLLPGIPHLGTDAAIRQQAPERVVLVNGIGSTADCGRRRALFETLRADGYDFMEVRHPSAVLPSAGLSCGTGCQVLAGAVVGPGGRLGDNVLVNTRAVVEHDCRVGDHVHIASGAVLCGGCRVGDAVHVGAGAVIIQGIEIGNGAIIAAGAVVTENVEPLTLIAGVPGKAKRTLDDSRLEKDRP